MFKISNISELFFEPRPSSLHVLLAKEWPTQYYGGNSGKLCKQGSAETTEKNHTKREREFLRQVFVAIEKRLDDPGLRTGDLAQEMMLSNTQLWRKIKAITGASAGEIIERVRLDKAAELIELGHLSISEIAYEVGYSDPSYFTKRFSRRFGEVPSAYLASRKNG